MHYNKNIYEAIFIDRPNRFNGKVKYNNEEIVVHVPNTGRCKEILKPGCKVFLREENNPNRKTKFDLIAAYKEDMLISIDSQIPNKVVKEALENKAINKLKKYDNILSEKTFGKSRFDFKLSNDTGEEYYLEVKGVTLEENKKCSFPDAPTERGVKHLKELAKAAGQGYICYAAFVIQMEGVDEVRPNIETHPQFAEALAEAKAAGVQVLCLGCSVGEDELVIDGWKKS